MRVFVTGATGFIGRALVPFLQSSGHTVVVWARSAARARARLGAEIDVVEVAHGPAALAAAVEECDAIVNLAGESILGGRWTAARRAKLRNSRVALTQQLAAAVNASFNPPRVLVSGSAVGFYGDRGDELLTESSSAGDGFLSELCLEWEAAARSVESRGVRVVLLRTGVVLGRDGGALGPLLLPFRLGVGGPIGSGRQYLPWIHLHDLVRVIGEALNDERFTGPINSVAPEAVTNRAFGRTLGRALRRPALMPLPSLALRAALGEAAIVLLGSQRVEPAALHALGFAFHFPTLASALTDILRGAPVVIGRLSAPVEPRDSVPGAAYLASHPPAYELRTVTELDAPVDRAFAFFSRAENLGLLTPSRMGFTIAGAPPTIGENTAIEYRMRVGMVPITWRSRIVNWREGVRFIDFQERGPYGSWWHEHLFHADGGKTVMEDRVCYRPPLGLLGRIANRLIIAPMLRRIFQYRAEVIRLRFGGTAP